MTQDGTFTYTWDAENRLKTVTHTTLTVNRSQQLTFVYDHMGRRVRKTVKLWNGTSWASSTVTLDRKFVYDGWNLIEELDALNGTRDDAKVLCQYSWGLDLGGQTSGLSGVSGIHGAGGIGGLLSMHHTNGTTTTSDDKDYLYFYDANGNVGQLIDVSDGSVDAKYEYYPYGGELSTSGTGLALTNSFRFSTKYLDVESRAYYYGYRYHMPKHGRWLNRDPLDEYDNILLYSFVRNRPSSLFDMDGRQCPTVISVGKPHRDKCGGFYWEHDLLCHNLIQEVGFPMFSEHMIERVYAAAS